VNVHGNLFYRFGVGATPLYNKGSGNTFANNLFVRTAWLPYFSGGFAPTDGSGYLRYNQGWLNGGSLPSGNVSNQDPYFLDEARLDLANEDDGTITITGGTESIPFWKIGIQ
jgi:hypothetical protein